ncbi:TetR/AcrR family transcriptional regulator [Streptomyces sp. NPDC018057]|uniref:TetR/AcrR family transcriptional regulator n=1 Tax=unclassified Streptomyces TaxID=2593676 RepID=UPI0037AD6A83
MNVQAAESEQGSTRQGRRRAPLGEARRERIVAVAFQEFSANGYRGASLARIAAGAGLTQPGLLHHFRSKADLLIAVLEERDRRDSERHDIDLDAQVPWRTALRNLTALVEHNARAAGLVQLFTVMTAEAVTEDHPARRWAVERYRRLEGYAGRALQQGIDDGEVRPEVDAVVCAQRIFSMMDGLQLQWLLDPDRVDMAAVFRGFMDDLERSIEV